MGVCQKSCMLVGIIAALSLRGDELYKLSNALNLLASSQQKKGTESFVDRLFASGKLKKVGKAYISGRFDFAKVQQIRVPQQSAAECVANATYNALVLTMVFSVFDENRALELLAYFDGDKRPEAWNKFKQFLLNNRELLGIASNSIDWLENFLVDRLLFQDATLFDKMVDAVHFPREMRVVRNKIAHFEYGLNPQVPMINLFSKFVSSVEGVSGPAPRIGTYMAMLRTAVVPSDYAGRLLNIANATDHLTQGRAVLGGTLYAGGHNTCMVFFHERDVAVLLYGDSMSQSEASSEVIAQMLRFIDIFGSRDAIERNVVRLAAYEFIDSVQNLGGEVAQKAVLKRIKAGKDTMLKALKEFNTRKWLKEPYWQLYAYYMKAAMEKMDIIPELKEQILAAFID